jgi:HD-like signal output (HDOD) protein
MEVLVALRDPQVSFEHLEKLVTSDVGLSAYTLRTAGSPEFGSGEPVNSVSEAIRQLELDNFRSLSFTYAAGFLYKAVTDLKVRRQLWEHAVSVGVLAKTISEETAKGVPAQVFGSGLMHDIGKILLFLHDQDTFKASWNLNPSSELLADEEFERFGFSHIEAGHFLLNRLGFSKELKEVVLFHHNPEYASSGNPAIWIVALANQLHYRLDDPTHQSLMRYLLRLDLTKAQLQEIAEKGKSRLPQYISLF